MEQSHGFCHGIALAIAMLLLAKHSPRLQETTPRRRLPEGFAIAFVLLFITLMNVYKNVDQWTKDGIEAVPAMMKAPFIASVNCSAECWFLLVWIFFSLVIIRLMVKHSREALPLIPSSYLARGQLLYLAFLWIIVIANFERALVAFTENRLITEGVILINAGLATLLILSLPRVETMSLPAVGSPFPLKLRRMCLQLLPLLLCLLLLMAASVRLVYKDQPLENPNTNHKRWGEDAQWRMRPILKGGRHL